MSKKCFIFDFPLENVKKNVNFEKKLGVQKWGRGVQKSTRGQTFLLYNSKTKTDIEKKTQE